MIDFQNLLKTGYYFGSYRDYIDDYSEFRRVVDELYQLTEDLDANWICEQVSGIPNNLLEIYKPLLPHRILPSHREERLRQLKDLGFNNLGCSHFLVDNEYTRKYFIFFNKIVENIKNRCGLYPNETEWHAFQSIQCYMCDDSLNPHTDDHNNAFAALILYLSRKEDYRDSGGELYLPHLDVSCPPVEPYFSLLDLTMNNPRHEVKKVTDLNFKRLSFLNFIKKNNN